jgi:transposase
MRASEFIVEVVSTATPERLEDLKKLYDSGTSNADIAKLLDISADTVTSWLNKVYPDRVKRRQPLANVDVELLKKLVDQRKTYAEISSIMGYPPKVVMSLIKSRYKDRPKKFTPVKLTPERLKDIKDAYDLGYSLKEIGILVNTGPSQVGNILVKYYPERTPRLVHAAKAATPEDKKLAIDSWNAGNGIKNIANSLGVDADAIINWLTDELGADAIKKEQERRKTVGGSLRTPNKVTPEIRDKIRELYVTGMTLDDIAIAIGGIIASRNVESAMTREPDYAELRAARDARKQKVKTGNVTTKKFTRAGERDNLRSKGPQNRHTSGVHWPKYG